MGVAQEAAPVARSAVGAAAVSGVGRPARIPRRRSRRPARRGPRWASHSSPLDRRPGRTRSQPWSRGAIASCTIRRRLALCSLRTVSVTTESAQEDRAAEPVKTDQVIVLFGATGDLAKRKLLPGMFHLSQVGLMPEGFRIIGAARHPISTDEFRDLARESVAGFGTEVGRRRRLRQVRRVAQLRRRRRRLRGARQGGRSGPRGTRRRGRAPLLPLAAAESRGRDGRRDRQAGARRGRAGDHREALRHRPRLGPRTERTPPLGLPGGPDLPDRPLPGARGGAEPAGAALRQRHVRAGLEPQPHRPRPDRHPGDALDRNAWLLLRGHGRLPRHARHAPVPAARLRRDGAADLAGAEAARDRAREGLRLDAAAAARGRRPRPVRRLPRRGRGRPATPTPRP